MNGELIWVLSLLAIAVVLFATGKVRMDAIALMVIVAFVLSGTLTLNEAFSGFSDPNVILIAALFIIGDGLVRTGVATKMGAWLVSVAGNSETKMLIYLMLTVAGLGAFMSSTGVVAIFIPVVLSVSARMNTSPSRLMMPLSFAGLISGMMTLVATPPNLVVNSELLREGLHGFSFFSVTPIGLVVLILGIVYMLAMRFMLKTDNGDSARDGRKRSTFRDLIREYHLTGRARRLAIRPGSPMIGQRLDDLKLRERYCANVIGVERWRRFRRVIVNVNGVSEFRARDVLLIDMSASDVDLRQFCGEQMLEPMVLRGEYFADQALDVGMAEVALIPDSEMIGKTVREIAFRTRFGLNIVGMKRDGKAMDGSVVDEPLQLGDILLVVGNWRQIALLAKRGRDFVVLNMPVEVDDASPAHSQAPHAIFCLVLMVALMLTDEIPNPIAAIIACLLMGQIPLHQCRERLQGDPLAEHYFDCWDDAVCPGAAKNRRGGSGGEGTDGCRRRRGALSDARLPVHDVRGDWAVYLKHRHGGADGAYCLSGGEVNGRLSLSFCHGGGDGGFGGVYDPGLLAG